MSDTPDAERLASFNRMVYDLVHELKSPLVSIRGFAEILAERAQTRLSQDELGYLERIVKNVDRLSSRIEDIRRQGLAEETTPPGPDKK